MPSARPNVRLATKMVWTAHDHENRRKISELRVCDCGIM